jgi:eukaryotic-like serine/threonine-protein kinase
MGLTLEQWESVKELFEAALEKPLAERGAFLTEAAPDPAVRNEVERLLANHTEAGGFLSSAPLPAISPPSHSSQPSLVPGDLLSERFRITRFLASGGMGEVYEAEDLELHERVALKTIRSELLRDPRALERFKREVHLAKKVTHANVCRIFDLFRQPSGSSDGFLFVVMELLEGETLAERLRREPRLRASDALPIALQMAAGLGAAHDVGVLHRDFKPGNALLVPSPKGIRAVTTDFGLALRSGSDSSVSGNVTGTGESLGTPAYMSPEQVEGRELTPASDVYSLGLVLYEMVTGARAFEEDTPLAMAVKRLRENPTPPRTLVPDLDRRWEAVILCCLQREPKDRYQNANEIGAALRGEINPRIPRRQRIARRFAAVLAFLLALGAILVFAPKTRQQPKPETSVASPPSGTTKPRPSVAVLPFRNLSGNRETQWFSTALPDMLAAELAAGEKFRMVPGESIARASADLGIKAEETLAKDTLVRLRQYLGSDFVVLGSYLAQGVAPQAQIRLDLWLQDTTSGEIVASVSEKSSGQQLDDLATRAGADLRQKLGVGEVTPQETASLKALLPSDPEAVRLYSEGLARLRVLDARAARDLLEKASRVDPKFALIHSALADAWKTLGYDQNASEQAKKALDLSAGLPREQHLWIEGRYWELNRKWDKAVEIYRTLFDFFPDNIDYGLYLANAQKQARTVEEALATLDALRHLPSPAGEDPRIDLQQADVFDVKGAYQQQQAASSAAVTRARALGAKLLLARALNQTARSLEKQGKLEDAIVNAQEAVQISTASNELAELAKALTLIGIVRFDQGRFADAVSSYQQALTMQQQTGDRRGAATTLNDIANALGEQGDLAGSIKISNESLAMFREVGDKHSVAAVLGSIAARTIQLGDLSQAKKMLAQALAASREIGDHERTATAVYNLGEVLRFQGDLVGAEKMYAQALSMSNLMNDQSGVAYALHSMGDILTARGDLGAARQKYSQAFNLRNQIGEKGTAAETQLALAALTLEEGHLADAAAQIPPAREEFRKSGSTDDEILANMLLARVLVADQKISGAESQISTSHELLTKSQDFSVRLKAAIVAAEVHAASGRNSESCQQLESALALAAQHGYQGLQYEARLALSEAKLHSGDTATRTQLQTLSREARLKGFGLIARKAASLSRSIPPSH